MSQRCPHCEAEIVIDAIPEVEFPCAKCGKTIHSEVDEHSDGFSVSLYRNYPGCELLPPAAPADSKGGA